MQATGQKDIFDHILAMSSIDTIKSNLMPKPQPFLKNSVRHRMQKNRANNDIDGLLETKIQTKAYPREHW